MDEAAPLSFSQRRTLPEINKTLLIKGITPLTKGTRPVREFNDRALFKLVDQVLEWAKLNHELSRICTRPDEPHFIATAKRIKQAEEQAKEDGKKDG